MASSIASSLEGFGEIQLTHPTTIHTYISSFTGPLRVPLYSPTIRRIRNSGHLGLNLKTDTVTVLFRLASSGFQQGSNMTGGSKNAHNQLSGYSYVYDSGTSGEAIRRPQLQSLRHTVLIVQVAARFLTNPCIRSPTPKSREPPPVASKGSHDTKHRTALHSAGDL